MEVQHGEYKMDSVEAIGPHKNRTRGVGVGLVQLDGVDNFQI
jgi:hypothetical protein